ncbi:TonB-dependent receptor, partial [candidate division KSB1 bacterium]|nr:TonB-dependent receptor [candidate division KSB1 bacterium]
PMCLAQSTVKINGTVIDGLTNKPLCRANVIVEGSGFGSVTDQRGYFEIENLLEGTYDVTASYMGYAEQIQKNVRIPKDQPLRLHFKLNPMVIKMKAVEVSAESYRQDANPNVYVIYKNEINRTNYSSVGEILDRVPGIEVQNTGAAGSSKKISIRGSQTNQVLVLLDGIPLNDELGGDADLSQIPINIIEKIEVYKGGHSAGFGSGAVGGVIYITTQKTFDNSLKLNTSYGSFGFFNAEPGWSGKIGNLGYYFAYNYIQNDGNYPYSYEDSKGHLLHENRINADILSRNIFAGFNFVSRGHFISVQAQRLQSDRGIPGKIHAWTAYARAKNRQDIYGAEYQFTRPKWHLYLNCRYSNSANENMNIFPPDAELRYRRYSQWHYQYMMNNYILQNKILYKPQDWLQLTLGYSGRILEYRDENFIPFLKPPINAANEKSFGVYLHQEWNVNVPQWHTGIALSPVFRYDEMELGNGPKGRFESQWSPGMGCFLAAGERHSIFLKSNISRSFRVPTLADLFYQDVRIEGKPDLAAEKSLNTEIGLGIRLAFWGKVNGEINHFSQQVEDLIVWRMGSYEVFRPFNTDAEISGREYFLEYSTPNEDIILGFNYTLLEPLNKTENLTTHNKILPYRPQTLFKASLSVFYGNWHGSVFSRNVSKRFVNEANTKEMPPYHIIDVDLSWTNTISLIELTWKLTALNILNQDYEIIRDMPLPKREWRVGLSLKI